MSIFEGRNFVTGDIRESYYTELCNYERNAEWMYTNKWNSWKHGFWHLNYFYIIYILSLDLSNREATPLITHNKIHF
jgi:hypothetical protein